MNTFRDPRGLSLQNERIHAVMPQKAGSWGSCLRSVRDATVGKVAGMTVTTSASVAKRGFEYYQGTSVEKLIANSLKEYLEVDINIKAGGSVEGIFEGVKLTRKVSLRDSPPPNS